MNYAECKCDSTDDRLNLPQLILTLQDTCWCRSTIRGASFNGIVVSDVGIILQEASITLTQEVQKTVKSLCGASKGISECRFCNLRYL